MRIGISSSSFPSLSVEEIIRTAGKLKVNEIALDIGILEGSEDANLSRLQDLFAAAELSLSFVSGHKSGVVEDTGKEQAAGFKERLNLCRQLGSGVLTFAASPDKEPDELTGLCSELVEIAAGYGVSIALDTSLPTGIDGLGRIVEKIDSAVFGFHFDLGKFFRLGGDPVKFASYLGKYTHAVTVNDLVSGNSSGSVPIGKGEIKIPEIVSELTIMGYEGPYCVEIDTLGPGYKDETAVVKTGVKYLKKLGKKGN